MIRLKPGDRVSDGGRIGTILGVVCNSVAWVRWEADGLLSYVALADLFSIIE